MMGIENLDPTFEWQINIPPASIIIPFRRSQILGAARSYFLDPTDVDKYVVCREALDTARAAYPGLMDAPFLAYSAAMDLDKQQRYDASAGFMDFAFMKEITGNPMTDMEGDRRDDKATYAIVYLFALEHYRKNQAEVTLETAARYKNLMAEKWEVIARATCLMDFLKDICHDLPPEKIGRLKFSLEDLRDASAIGHSLLPLAAM